MEPELEFYKEHVAHGRHIETQRSAVAGIAATLSGAIIGQLLKGHLDRSEIPYTVTLFFVGSTAWLLSAKLYERFKLHNQIAKKARNAVAPQLEALRTEAEKEHKKRFPKMYALPLHNVWYVLFGVIASTGVVLTILIVTQS